MFVTQQMSINQTSGVANAVVFISITPPTISTIITGQIWPRAK